jgi:predicted glycoside hydrolase/deacetylase ChbG (UPF0249 family)
MTQGLVVNADDLGVSRGATLGIVEAHTKGIVTSASLAATTPFYEHALAACVKECPGLGIGLHFTLTSGRPVSPLRDVPLLVDDTGFFRWRFVPLLRSMAVGRRSALLEQIGIELEAQLQKIIKDGVRPDHIDGERHVHLIPGVLEAVIAAAARHRVPFVRCGDDLGPGLMEARQAPQLFANGGMAKSWLLGALTSRARKQFNATVTTANHFASYLYSGRPELFLKRMLLRPPEPGVTELMVHPGLPDESRELALGNREVERYLGSPDRKRELDLCIEARAWAGAFRLTTFAKLAQERGMPS